MARSIALWTLTLIALALVLCIFLKPDAVGASLGGGIMAAIYSIRRERANAAAKALDSKIVRTPIKDISFKCDDCGEQSTSDIQYGTLEMMRTTLKAGCTQTCRTCRKMLRCREDNVSYTVVTQTD